MRGRDRPGGPIIIGKGEGEEGRREGRKEGSEVERRWIQHDFDSRSRIWTNTDTFASYYAAVRSEQEFSSVRAKFGRILK